MIALHAAALLLAASSFAAAPVETSQLVYALPVAVPAAVGYVAVDKGFFREEGLDVEAKLFSSGREGLQALLAGQAQLQTVSETPVTHAIIQGNPLVTIATIARHKEAKVLARGDRGIKRPEDLRGKRVATLPGTNSDYFMYKFLEKHGLTPADVKIANMAPPEMVVALAKGDIDAFFAWEPHIHYGQRNIPEATVVFPAGDLYDGRATLNMDPRFAAQNPGTVRAVVRAMLKAEDFVRRHPDESAELLAKRLNMDREVLRDLMKESEFRVELDARLLPLMKDIGRWALDQKGLSKQPLPDFRAHIDARALRREKPNAVKL